MKLEKEQKRDLIRIILSAVLLLAAALLPTKGLLRLLTFALPYALIGFPVFIETFEAIKDGDVFNEDLLMLVASLGAFALGEYTEAVLVLLLYAVGELCEDLAEGKSREAISALTALRPDAAVMERDGQRVVLSPEEVRVGDVLLVPPGQRIPLDGVILSGTTTLDTSALTGEALPQEAAPGDVVLSSCVNLSGVIRVRVTKPYTESTVQRILELVENSVEKKAKTQRFITKFAKVYTPIVTVSAVILAVLPPLLGFGLFRDWIYRALNFLVISCPCALVISVPLSFFGGIGGASRAGILIKGASDLETLAKCDTFAFDKTGTLTTGKLSITELRPIGISQAELLHCAAVAEHFSNHPVARAIREADKLETDENAITNVSELPGNGISADYRGERIHAGNRRLMERLGVEPISEDCIGTPVYVAKNAEYLGCIWLSDTVKPEAAEGLSRLKEMGISRLVLLTGDKKAPAERLCGKLGISEVHAELLPQDKAGIVETMINGGKTVAFVGDGVNDAPVLALASVGIAMGGLGSDAAIESADIVLMDDDVRKIPLAVKIARRTLKIAKENIIFALSVKFIVLLLSLLGFAPLFLAVLADVGVTLLAILNALRCLRR